MSAPARSATGPLAGMRVLELAQIMAGPTCGVMLADLGADVIKVEKLPGGDDSRSYREPRVNGVSAPFLMLNRNKRGIALDLKEPRGKRRPAAARRAGPMCWSRTTAATRWTSSAWATRRCRQVNPALIYCAITGFGRDGPLADKGGFDLVAQGFAGLMSITGEPGRPPAKTGNPVSDINAGLLATIGVLAAYANRLQHRPRAARRHVAVRGRAAADLLARGELFRDRRLPGPARLRAHPDRAVPGVPRERRLGQHRRRQPGELGAHRRGARASRNGATTRASPTNTARMEHREALVEAMNAVLGAKTRAEWIALLDAAGVPAGPVHTLGEALAHPQTLARGMVVETVHPDAGPTRAVGCPIHFSETPAARQPPGAAARRAHPRAAARVRLRRRGDRRSAGGGGGGRSRVRACRRSSRTATSLLI